MNGKALLGPWGEALAADYLRRRGYRVAAANYRCRLGEIDLIVRRGPLVAFVEVKLRASAAFAEAREFVDRRKQGRIRAAASLWLAEHGGEDLQARFDVVEVYAPQGLETRRPRIVHIEDAFA